MLNKIKVKDIVTLAKKAGEAIAGIYEKNFDVEFKADESPLTEADKAAHKIIVAGLLKLDQSNENSCFVRRRQGDTLC